MIFTDAHWYYGLLQLFLLGLDVLAAFGALRFRRFGLVWLWVTALWFLGYKIWEYVPFGRWPLDFSAVTYFLFALAALLPVRPLKTVASFSGLLAGACFIVTMIFLPGMHYSSQPTGQTLIMAILNHNLLFAGGLILAGRQVFKKRDLFWIAGWLVLVIAYIEILTHCFGIEQSNAVFTKIMDGSVICLLLGKTVALPWWYYVVYYLFCAGLLALLLFLFFKLNRKLYASPPQDAGEKPAAAEEGAALQGGQKEKRP